MEPLASPALAGPATNPQREYLVERYAWLVRVRWLAVAGALGAAFVPIEGLAHGAIATTALALGAANGFFAWRLRHNRLAASTRDVEDEVFAQLLCDVGALAFVLHFSGGGENPFAFLYPLPMALGATLLRTGQAASLAVTGTACHFLVVLGELSGALPHHSLDSEFEHAGVENPLFGSPSFVVAYLLAFTLMNFGVVYFARSVTARFHRAEALRRDREQLAESRERLARIGELSAGVAHTIRNPVHGLLNAISLLQTRHGADPETGETLELMAEALGRVETVTRRLLVLGRDTPLHLAPCEVDALVEDVAHLASPKSRDSAATLEVTPGGAGTAQLDAAALSEALVNVLDNALDACEAGGRVTLRSRGEGAWVVVEVGDEGPGISPEHLHALFDPFFTTKAVGRGTGLGLAIARRIVEAHDGTISVTSAPKQGTTVQVRLPRTRREPGGSA